MNKTRLVICPVHNEENTLQIFYSRLRGNYSGNVLFIDDGCMDNCRKILKGFLDHRTFLIKHPRRMGYGRTLLDGLAYSLDNNYTKTVTIDTDLQHDPDQINDFFTALDECEVVLGTRYIAINRCYDIPSERLLINRYITGLFHKFFSFPVSDPFCGFRGYTRSFLERAYLEEESYGFALEVLMEMIKDQTPYKEIPIAMKYIDISRQFHSGLNNARVRLLHYLDVIERKRKESAVDMQKAAV